MNPLNSQEDNDNANAKKILEILEHKTDVSSDELGIPISALHGTLLSLESKGQVLFEMTERLTRVLTADGKKAVECGSEEFNLFNEIPDEGKEASVLQRYPQGSNYAFRNRWLKAVGDRVVKCRDTVEDEVVRQLERLTLLDEKEYASLKKRRLVDQVKSNVYLIRKGPQFGVRSECLTELTSRIVANYNGEVFKSYNFDSVGNIPQCGSLHPLMKIREEIKRIFLDMGFSEMNTSRYVESSFWNFDTLFQPQNHPSRDAQDTFFMKTPETAGGFDEEYFNRVKSMHSDGGFGSVGHQSPWDPKEAAKNILRTHTTAVSSRYLKSLAGDFKPTKLFSVDKVFRNESVDATHLAEFHQVEGLIAGYDLGLGDLMGFLKAFYEKLGLRNIKFKPAFNPYTEPSMEVFGYHEGLKRWIEIGNSGIFRPEMLRPMGFEDNVSVIAWGLSLERPAMIKYGLNNIRDLVGHRVDINFIRRSEFIYF